MKKIAIVGGGAAGMACAVRLGRRGYGVTLLERGERLGRKLAASGNGQGNVTNLRMDESCYFSDDRAKVARTLAAFTPQDCICFLESMGGVFLPDARGRVYPASRQASSVTDLFRRELDRLGVRICFGAQVRALAYDGEFALTWASGRMCADAVVLASGGKAAKNFGTDGSSYALARGFGHTVTPLSPALVQLRCDPAAVRGMRGVRTEAGLGLFRGEEKLFSGRGDILFTESGVSGDLAFRASSYAEKGDRIVLDLAPDVTPERLAAAAGGRGEDGLLAVVHGAIARALARRASGEELLSLVKAFPLEITGTLGFDYAQVTKGGIPLSETDDCFMSKKRAGLYFAGEILNADGICGGYNLHWAFATARAVAEGMR